MSVDKARYVCEQDHVPVSRARCGVKDSSNSICVLSRFPFLDRRWLCPEWKDGCVPAFSGMNHLHS